MPASSPVSLDELISAAERAAGAAYAPYSRFPVGAALVTDDGRIFAGGNVENASYGLSMCAERNAIFQMVSAGGAGRAIHALVVYTPTAQPTAPCGACRQVIQEFGPAARIVCVCGGPARLDFAQSDLLPGAFGPANLKS